MLHRHPSEVALSPLAYIELRALREIRDPDLCKACRNEELSARLWCVCDRCGTKFKDPDIKRILKMED